MPSTSFDPDIDGLALPLRLEHRLEELRRRLGKLPGLQMHSAFAGQFAVGAQSAQVELAMMDLLRVWLEIRRKMPAKAALELAHALPGNMRLALENGRRSIVTGIRLDAGVDLNQLFAIHEAGFRRGLRGETSEPNAAPAPSCDEVEAALAGAKLGEDAVVRLDSGWQFHPRLAGEPVPIEARFDGDGLRVYRVLLEALPEMATLEAVADQALRCNARLRQCRLASTGAKLVAEARLHAGSTTSAALEASVRAVAVADRHLRAPLEILARDPEVARQYRDVLMSS